MKTFLLATTALIALSISAAADPLKLGSINVNPAGDVLSPGLVQTPVAEGAFKLENPSKNLGYYGYGLDGPLVPAKGAVQSKDHNVEATKTEPDKNTYLVLTGAKGPFKGRNYGTHFLFQGHESGPTDDKGVKRGGITRVNLDAPPNHRVTLMADVDIDGKPLPLIDGSAWDPFAKMILLTSETGPEGGVWAATVDYPSKVTDISMFTGRASYEGVQIDSDGSVWLVEDAGGKPGDKTKNAKQPNSFIYRFVPNNKEDLTAGGKLQVLQALDAYGNPIVFHEDKVNEDILASEQKLIYGYGNEMRTRWVTIHEGADKMAAAFDANVLAKAAGGTPFKRPENGQFRPGTSFKEYYFTVTGDTNAKTEAGAEYGGFGGVMRLTQSAPAEDKGKLSIVFRGDVTKTGFDNLAFLNDTQLLIVEDGGDKLHGQRNAYDSGYVIDVTADYTKADPVRFLSQMHDDMAALTPDCQGRRGSRTTATTKSPAFTFRTVTRRSKA
ncbi:MAG: alkaline phosphatase PhoX [Bauldia sp.]